MDDDRRAGLIYAEGRWADLEITILREETSGRSPRSSTISARRWPCPTTHAHHAGDKESGMGGEDGKWGMLRYTQIKTAYQHDG